MRIIKQEKQRTMNTVLIIADATKLAREIEVKLGLEGFAVDSVRDGGKGIELAASGSYDLAVLDDELPGMSGFEVLHHIRRHATLPLIMLTEGQNPANRILGLEMGADDCLGKPFLLREFLARSKACIRRHLEYSSSIIGEDSPIVVDDLVIKPSSRSAHLGDSTLNLTKAEYKLLHSLVRNAGKVMDRDQLARNALGRPMERYDRSLDVHISHLRKKLSCENTSSGHIRTVRGTGYMFVPMSQAG